MSPRSILFCLLLPAALLGQVPGAIFNRAPGDIETSLRDRIAEFYKLQMEGKFRAGEKLVCEESQDAYYDMHKERWLGFEIVVIRFEDEFKSANASVALKTVMSSPVGQPMPVTPVVTTQWRLRGGQWCFYLPATDSLERQTPFGTMFSGAKRDPNAPAAPAPAPRPEPASPQTLLAGVSLSKKEIHLRLDAPSTDTIEVSNNMPGPVDVSLDSFRIPGLVAEVTPASLSSGAKAILTVKAEPISSEPRSPVHLRLRVEPFGRVTGITVYFDAKPPAPPKP